MSRDDARRAAVRRALPALLALAGAVVFLGLGGWLCDGLPTWHEEVSIQSNLGYRVLPDRLPEPATGPLPVEPWCGDGSSSGARWVVSSSRPTLTLCVAGRSLPVMTMPYASGVFAWPMLLVEPVHHDDVFVQRKIGLVRGLLALLLLFLLVRRVAGRRTAGLACFLAGVSAPFVYPHVFLFPYETLPWTLVASAFWMWSGCRELSPRAGRDGPPPSTRRLLLGAMLAGMAVLANVKAVFLLAPLLVLAVASGVRVRRVRPAQCAAMALTAVVACAPMWIFALNDPQSGLSHQVGWRLAVIARKARPEAMGYELVNLLTFGSDVGFYMEQVGGRAGTLFPLGLAVVALPIAYAVAAGASRVVRRPFGSRLAAICGVVLAAYYFVSLLLYDQFPSANYSPLHVVFGATYAAFCADAGVVIARRAARRGGMRLAAGGVSLLLAAPIAAVLVWATLRHGDPATRMTTSMNAEAERQAARYLLAHPADPGGELMTTSYNLAGVLDALGDEKLHPVQAHPLLEGCRDQPPGAVLACLRTRLRWVLRHDGVLPLRLVIPAVVTAPDSPREVHEAMPAALREVASDLGLALSIEARFRTRAGDEVIHLVRVERSPPATPQAGDSTR